ncbi:winged helix-turn-helix domain-containing protein, partial [Mycolicibacterium sp. CBMA 361]
MVSWANSEADGTGLDLHLDLGQTVSPGRRGTRDQLIRALRDAVRSGRLPAGTMLPASRSLATDLGLARNTVAESYAELVAEGWLAARQGAGTWVVGAHPEPTIT